MFYEENRCCYGGLVAENYLALLPHSPVITSTGALIAIPGLICQRMINGTMESPNKTAAMTISILFMYSPP